VPQHDDKLHDKLIHYLEDAYGMENQLVEALQKQVEQTKDYPTVQTKVRQHLTATEQHRQRIEGRLNAYNKKPSAIKGMLSGLMGNTQGVMGGTRSDALAMTSRDDYVAEHFEIGTYTLLITLARIVGDEDTVRVCELNLRDDVEMQQWLAQHLPEALLLSLQEDGITIPQPAWQFAQQAQTMGIQGMLNLGETRQTVPPPM
jgi:ferritin-like metal-binding protein YciE